MGCDDRQMRDGTGAAQRHQHLPVDKHRHADGLAGIEEQAGTHYLPRRTQQQFGSRHRLHVLADRDRHAESGGQHLPHRDTPPAENRMVDSSRCRIHGTAGGDTTPQQPTPAEPVDEFGQLIAQITDSRLVARCADRMAVQGPSAEVGDGQQCSPCADVHSGDAQCVSVDGEGMFGSPDTAGVHQIGPVDDQTDPRQCGDLTVDGRR